MCIKISFKEGWPGILISGDFETLIARTGWLIVYGRKFRRQHGIGNYIVDFCCPSEKLVIELDGDQHSDYDKLKKIKREINILRDLVLLY
jgi:very-short-patch-repair endonuclease